MAENSPNAPGCVIFFGLIAIMLCYVAVGKVLMYLAYPISFLIAIFAISHLYSTSDKKDKKDKKEDQ
jgi:hypothetical protein